MVMMMMMMVMMMMMMVGGGDGYSGGGFGRYSPGGEDGGDGETGGPGEAGAGQNIEVSSLSTQHFNITPGNYSLTTVSLQS